MCGAESLAAQCSVFTFTVASEGAYVYTRRGSIAIHQGRWRVDLAVGVDEPASWNTVIGGDRRQPVAVNDSLKTWFEVDAAVPFVLRPSLFDFYRANQTRARDIRVMPAASQRSAGTRALDFSYRTDTTLADARLRGTVTGRISLSAVTPEDGAIHSQPALRLLNVISGDPEVDRAIIAQLTTVSGCVTRVDIDVERVFADSPPMTQRVRLELVSPPASSASSNTGFDVPAGYQHRQPQYGVP